MTSHADQTISEEAARWWSRRESAGAEARQAFAQWLAADPRHGVAYDAIAAAWDALGESGDEASDAGTDAALVRLLDTGRRADGRGRMVRRGLIGAGIAAALAGGFILTHMTVQPKPPVEFSTGAGQTLHQVLADGTSLDLDANSIVRVAMGGKRRDVDLVRGRVLFDVSHDAHRPFVVSTGNGTVTVLGTMFTVEYRDGETAATLFRGHVRAAKLSDPQASADLLPGDAVRIGGGDPVALSHHVDLTRALLWRQGRLVFENETLSRVVSRMNDYSGDRIVISDPAAARLHISGIFQAGRNGAFLDALKSYYGLAVTHRGHDVIITSARIRS